MQGRRAVLLLVAAIVVVAAAGVTWEVRLAARGTQAGWQAPPAAGEVPPPPLGGAAPAAGATPRVLRVDSSGCAPVEEQGFTAAMSLDSVVRAGGIPFDNLVRGLGLPADVSHAATLGDLMRRYHFSLGDVRRVVEDYLKHCE